MAIFKTYKTFLDYAYYNLCSYESQVMFIVYTNRLEEINIKRTAVYSGNSFIPQNLVLMKKIVLSNNSNGYKIKYSFIFQGNLTEVNLVRLKLVFLSGDFYNFDCFRSDTDTYTISSLN